MGTNGIKHGANSVQIELVRGCNMKCGFCGNYSLPDEKKYMTIETWIELCKQVKQFGKIRAEIALRGEPTLHPDIAQFIGIMRNICPQAQIMVITNGTCGKDVINDMFRAGLNILFVDCYGGSYSKHLAMVKSVPTVRSHGLKILDHVEDKISPWRYYGVKKHFVIMMSDLKNYHKSTRSFTNQCGAISEEAYDKYGIQRVPEPLAKRCVMTFREISVHYNGDVPICCKDWVGRRILCNIHNRDLWDLWCNDEILMKIRKLHFNRNRKMVPCNECNHNGGAYQGFIQNMGEYKNRKEVVSDLEIVEEARCSSELIV